MSYREYLDDLVRVVFEEVFEKPRHSSFVDALMKILITDDLSSQYERRSREEVVVRHVSCFSKGTVGNQHTDHPDQETPAVSGLQHRTGWPL